VGAGAGRVGNTGRQRISRNPDMRRYVENKGLNDRSIPCF